MSEKERAKVERSKVELENRLLRLEKAIQELMIAHIGEKLEERGAIISLMDVDLDDMEPRTPGLV